MVEVSVNLFSHSSPYIMHQSDSVECSGNMSASIALNKTSSSGGPGVVGQSQKVKQEYFAKLNGHQNNVIRDHSFDSDDDGDGRSGLIKKTTAAVRILSALKSAVKICLHVF